MSKLLRSAGAVAGALLIVVLAGCATGTAAAPAALNPSPSCGEYTLDQGESIPDEAVECMASAGGTDATLTVTAPTIEGDPIVTVYTALPDGSIKVHTDMTEDRFGGGMSVRICPDAVSALKLGGCGDEPVD